MGIEVFDRVMEGQTSYIAARFTDEDGAPVAPSSISYRVDDLETKESLLVCANYPAPGSNVLIEILPEVNRIVDDAKDLEVHVCTVVATYGSGKRITGEHRFGVVNLSFHEVEES